MQRTSIFHYVLVKSLYQRFAALQLCSNILSFPWWFHLLIWTIAHAFLQQLLPFVLRLALDLLQLLKAVHVQCDLLLLQGSREPVPYRDPYPLRIDEVAVLISLILSKSRHQLLLQRVTPTAYAPVPLHLELVLAHEAGVVCPRVGHYVLVSCREQIRLTIMRILT